MSMFKKATRKRVSMKLALTGPSGSGKTLSGLLLARGLAGPEGRIALLDTENDSASLYAHHVDFDTVSIGAPFTVQRYIAVIEEAVREGYNVLVIDSLSHAWAADGGLLSQKEAMDSHGGNKFNNWAPITKLQEQFKSALLQSPIHIIATMRSKQEYIVENGTGGKTAPRKVGMAPIQRDGMEYEFSTIFDVGMGHDAFVSKDRTGLFDGVVGVLTAKHGQQIKEWLETGAEPDPEPTIVRLIAPSAPPRSEFWKDAMMAFMDRAVELGHNISNGTVTKSPRMARELAESLLPEPVAEDAWKLPETWNIARQQYLKPPHTSDVDNSTPTQADTVKPSPNQCSVDGCTNTLTPGQLTLSQNKFGRPVCLKHQKDVAPTSSAKPAVPATPAPKPEDEEVPLHLADMDDPFADESDKPATPYAGASRAEGAM